MIFLFGFPKCSISAKVNSRTLGNPDLGAISFLKAFPMVAPQMVSAPL